MIERLEPFIGEWSVEAAFPDVPPADMRGRSVFEWTLGRQFLVQRSEVAHPDAPDCLSIMGVDQAGKGYVQHYFDSRGVARIYEMSFADGVWKLSRTKADFTSLEFSQRFTGTFSDDGATIAGQWEICHDGSTWQLDFDLRYTKVT